MYDTRSEVFKNYDRSKRWWYDLETDQESTFKLEDIVKIFELESSKSVCRELILAKIRANKADKQEVITIADIFRAKVVDVSKDNLMIELTGNVNKIEAFINLISDFEVIEIVRTGITGLSRGEDNSHVF